MKITMDKKLIVHVVSETVVFVVAAVAFQYQLRNVKKQIELIQFQLSQQEEKTEKCLKHINQLYMILESQGILPPPPSAVKGVQSSGQSKPPQNVQQQMKQQQMQQQVQQQRMQMQKQAQQQQQQAAPPSMFDTILNIMPTMMMGGMGGNGGANMIIAELNKEPFKPKESDGPSITIVDDQETEQDPDILEALKEEPPTEVEDNDTKEAN